MPEQEILTEHLENKQLYDILYYVDGLGQQAIKYLKRLPKEEQIARKLLNGIHLRNTQLFPFPEKTNIIGKQMMAAHHGFVWLMDSKQKNLFDYIILENRTDKDITRPTIIGGKLKSGILEHPDYTEIFSKKQAQSIKLEKDRDAKKDGYRKELNSAIENISVNASFRYKIMVARMAGIKNPKRIPIDELNDLVDGILLVKRIKVPSIDEWFVIHCAEAVNIQNQLQEIDQPFVLPENDKKFEMISNSLRSGS